MNNINLRIGSKNIKTIFNNANIKINNTNKYKKWLLNPLYPENLIENTVINSITGIEQSQNTYKASDYIEIPDDVKTISVVNPIIGEVGYHVFCIYDENKKFIKGSYSNPNYDWYFNIPKNSKYDHIDFKLPENAKYIRFNSSSSGYICGGYYLLDIPENIEFIHNGNSIYEVDSVEELKKINALPGDIIKTKGYYEAGDLGNAIYDIMTYDEFHKNLPNDIKVIRLNGNTLKTPVDGFGNHTLNNGLVAKLRLTGETTPEQWGAKSEESFNSCQSFVHMMAHIKTGKINLRKNGIYCLGLIYEDDTVENLKDNPYKSYMTGDLLGGQYFPKPIMANIKNVEFVGDNTTITIPNGVFGNSGMGILNFGGKINGLKFSGINFDGKGKYCSLPNKNSNHTIFYAPATFSSNHPAFKEIHPLYNKSNRSYDNGYVYNLEISNCSFKDAGATYKTSGDAGGDFILIVNPTAADNINIHNNHFESWGRWVFAIDLGGKGECLTNIKFDDNECIGSNAMNDDGSYIIEPDIDYDEWRWRALGLIDFEAKKCFDNVSFQRNYIHGTAGWAINGCSRISKNFLIKDNYYHNTDGGYPYTFELYSGIGKNIIVENNVFPKRCSFRCGYFTDSVAFINNKGLKGVRTFGLCGDIIFENNRKLDYEDENSYNTHMWSHELNNYNADSEYTLEKVKERGVNISIKNNDYAILAKFSDQDDIEKTSFFNIETSFDSPVSKANIIDFNNKFIFDPTNIINLGQGVVLKGVRYSKPFEDSLLSGNMPYFEKDEIIATNCQKWGVIGGDFYKNKLIENFSNHGYNWKNYSEKNNFSKISIICTEAGMIPSGAEYGLRETCTHISYVLDKGLTLQDGSYVNTDDYIYWTKNGGKLTQIPEHKKGMETYTDEEGNTIDLYYIGKVLKAKLIVE